MGRPGRKRRLVLEDEYWALIASAIGTGEACLVEASWGARRRSVARGASY